MIRFAVPPTADLSLDDFKIALLSYIVAEQKKEDFIIRFEDLNLKKNDEDKEQEILGILELFGIQYSQVIHQSKNFRFHSAMALQLLHEKKAFSCFCSNEWLENKRSEAKESNIEYKYDDACMNLPAELVIDNTNPFTIRIKKSTNDIVANDLVLGEKTFLSKDAESFIVMNHDKTPTQTFANAVDEILNDTSYIIRNEINIKETPKELHILSSLKYEKDITFVHLPKISNQEKKQLSVKSLLELGYLPSSILNYVISSIFTVPKDIYTLEEAIEWFNIEKISTSPIEFDIETLKKINRVHLNNLDAKELSRYVGFADEEIGNLAKLHLESIATTKELNNAISTIFSEKKSPPENLNNEFKTIISLIKNAPYFDQFDDFKNYLLTNSDIDESSLTSILDRILRAGNSKVSLSESYKYLKNYLGEIVK